jgi:CRISPR-associated endonuclease/helicase Cas3
LDRIIVVIPYTSIIEQTADVYRDFLGQDAVIEHHSAMSADADDGCQSRHQLATENWDAPVVVTTAVQFFESLFANTPSHCRKLHNIARSVVIIDEAQTLPLHLLKPTFELLAELVRHYSVTCLLTTATQPAYAKFTDLPIREIMPDPAALAQRLKRVRYRRLTKALSWTEVAEHMGGSAQAMAVLNTRADARALFAALPEESRLHLSTNLCGAHRREVLAEVRRRLSEWEPCLLATTQLVEAGVDLDFPLVMRAMGPLERIVQAAGRCNREGRLPHGETLVFQPKEGGLPPGSYKTATMATEAFLQNELDADLDLPDLHHRYFNLLYAVNDLDAKGITALRRSLDFPAVAQAYRIIEDDSVSVAVPWRDGATLLDRIEQAGEITRHDFRALQPYFVNLRKHELQRAQAQRLCREVILGSGLWRWEGRYDGDFGLQWEFDTLIF